MSFGINNDFPLLNLFKTSNGWAHAGGSGINGSGRAMFPDEMDSNGNPLPGGLWASNSGAVTLIPTPSQTDRPGHYVALWTGQGNAIVQFNGTGTLGFASCTGGSGGTFGQGVQCSNTGCSTFTGSISGTTLTVTSAPTGTGCALGAGVPIFGGSVLVSKFGTPTIITSAGSACSSNTCYTVNQSQTVSSTTMVGGVRLEWSVTTPFPTGNVDSDVYSFDLQATGSGSNYAQNFALFHVNDETAYWNSYAPCAGSYGQACITSGIFQTRIKQANFAVLRDLDYINGNSTNCTTWATRRPINYVSFGWPDELRNSVSAPGQYINALGTAGASTGAAGGTITYNSGTDTYTLTLGSGNWVDKQQVSVLLPAAGTSTSKISLNGNTAVNFLGIANTVYGSPGNVYVALLTYDAAFGGVIVTTQAVNGTHAGFECPVPPEVFVEMNAELKTRPWHVLPYLAMDAMTNWAQQYATYVQANYSQTRPIFEVSNEVNLIFGKASACYISAKSRVWEAGDPTGWAYTGGLWCGASGDNSAEVGKMASTVGQDLVSVFGAGGNFDLLAPTMPYLNNPTGDANMFTSGAYMAQNTSLIPIQSGYIQAPAYNYETGMSNNDYWANAYASVGNSVPGNRGIETALGYCYYNYSKSTPCQGTYASQAAVMTQYFSSATGGSAGSGNITDVITQLTSFITAAHTCFTFSTKPGSCTINQTNPMQMYEGGYQPYFLNANVFGQTNSSSDIVDSIASATNVSQAVLTTTNTSGCVQGMTVNLAGAGGTWLGVSGNYVVQSAGTNTCTINLNSTSLGTLGPVSTTAPSGYSHLSNQISVGSCTGIGAGQLVYDNTTGVKTFIGVDVSCTSGTATLQTNMPIDGTSGAALLFEPTITYTGSGQWVNYLRNTSYTASDLDTATTTFYNNIIGIGAVNPSQYFLSNQGGGYLAGSPWQVMAVNAYGYYPMASCTSCTISGSTLTLGGTITGVFASGQTLLGGSTITGVSTGAASNTTITGCTAVGSNVCGTTAGDTLSLSQASTVSTGMQMLGTIAPPTNNNSTGTTSPVRAWGAICRFNGNGSQCNGWLLKRDIDPASNDNDPVGLEKAA